MIRVGEIGILRAPEPSDLEWVFEIENDPGLWHLSASKEPLNKGVVMQYLAAQPGSLLRDGQLRFILDDRGRLKGAFDLFDYDHVAKKAGLGVYVDASCRREGVALQTLQALEEYAFSILGIRNLYAHVPQDNEASRALFVSAGYREVGVLTDWVWHDGQYVDACLFQKIKV
ncbi:MAG: hypothetical protein RL754_313 [Bacteroidota bacterium]|jgi:diamine N-acetyltransferase